jgi:hypothetical protein
MPQVRWVPMCAQLLFVCRNVNCGEKFFTNLGKKIWLDFAAKTDNKYFMGTTYLFL